MSPAEPGCIFCRIADRQLPADLLLETPLVVAFRDLDPKAPSHVLVVPREHVAHFGALGAHHGELLVALVAAAQAVAVQEGLAEGGYRVVANVGKDAGKTVDHLHLHVLGGRQLDWPPG